MSASWSRIPFQGYPASPYVPSRAQYIPAGQDACGSVPAIWNCAGMQCRFTGCISCSNTGRFVSFSLPPKEENLVHSDSSFSVSPERPIRRTFSMPQTEFHQYIPRVKKEVLTNEKINGLYPLHSSSSESNLTAMERNFEGRMNEKLVRKAELARESRKKKKLLLQEMKEHAEMLTLRISELESKLRNDGKQKPEKETHSCQQNVSVKSLKDIDQMEERQIVSIIQSFIGSNLQKKHEIEFLLTKGLQYLEPSSQEKFIMWALDQKESFYIGNGLWNSLLVNELGMSAKEINAIRSQQEALQKDKRDYKNLQDWVSRIKEEVENYYLKLNTIIDKMGKILTPRQLAKFIIWVESSDWCLHVLESLWNGPMENVAI